MVGNGNYYAATRASMEYQKAKTKETDPWPQAKSVLPQITNVAVPGASGKETTPQEIAEIAKNMDNIGGVGCEDPLKARFHAFGIPIRHEQSIQTEYLSRLENDNSSSD